MQERTFADVIVLVDDNEDMLQIFKAYLTKNGYNVHAFSDPKMAYEHIKYAPEEFAVLLSDIRMPGMSGFELARNVKALNSKIKIIFMTAFDFTMSELQDILPSVEIAGVLEKPFRLERFNELLDDMPIRA
jgi:DNA-binding NtrC family response regulator